MNSRKWGCAVSNFIYHTKVRYYSDYKDSHNPKKNYTGATRRRAQNTTKTRALHCRASSVLPSSNVQPGSATFMIRLDKDRDGRKMAILSMSTVWNGGNWNYTVVRISCTETRLLAVPREEQCGARITLSYLAMLFCWANESRIGHKSKCQCLPWVD